MGSAAIVSGEATFSSSALSVGPTNIGAVYGGSGTDFLGSTFNIATRTVTTGSGHCDEDHPDHGTRQDHDIRGSEGSDSNHVGDGYNTIHEDNGNDWVSAGHSSNSTSLGNGDSVITVLGGVHNVFIVGNEDNTNHLGGGSANTFKGGKGKNTCHVQRSAPSLDDVITNRTVVIP